MATPKLQLASFTGVMAKAAGTPTPDAEIDIALIDTKAQVRTKLGDLSSLTYSIKTLGVLEPVLLLAKDDGRYGMIAGERRFRAASAAGLTKIPALIKRGLSQVEIRHIQVTENKERENLSLFDEVMGVIEDVEAYGVAEAQRIWGDGPDKGKSAGWVSKRVAVQRYSEPVAELLRNGLCSDLEVLQSLHQLYGRSKDDFEHMAKRLREGTPLSREDVRAKVAAVKDWQNKETEVPPGKGAAITENQWAASNYDPKEPKEKKADDADIFSGKKGKGAGAADPKPLSGGKAAGAKTEPKGAAGKSGNDQDDDGVDTFTRELPGLDGFPAPAAAVQLTPEEVAEADRKETQRRLETMRRDIFDWGQGYTDQFKVMQKRLGDLGTDMNGTDWILWSGFLTTVLPLLDGLGDNKVKAFLNKLQSELKTKTPILMWRELHPLAPGADAESGDDGPRVQTPDMPEGWRF